MTNAPAPPRTAWIIVVAAVGNVLLIAGAIAAAVAVSHHVEAAPETPTCWNHIETDPCLPLEGLTGAMWAFDPNQVVVADCDRLRGDDYFPEAQESWHCYWPDQAVDVFIARFSSIDDGPAIWRDIADYNGFTEYYPNRWPSGDSLGPSFSGSTRSTKNFDAPFLTLCYDDIPYCMEIDAASNRGLEAAEDRIGTLGSDEVEAYLTQLAAMPSGDI